MADSYDGFPPDLYVRLRQWLLDNDPDAQEMLTWSREGCAMPATPEDLAGEIVWIILCAGRSAQAARTIEARVWEAIRAGRPVVEAFGYRAKAAAIERAWRERGEDFERLQRAAATGNLHDILGWCEAIPFVGGVTKFQLAKNFGCSVVKPDLWWVLFSGIKDGTRVPAPERFARCQQLALELSAATGDPVPVIDSLVWLGANKGLLSVSFDPHQVHFHPSSGLARRSIYEASPAPAPPAECIERGESGTPGGDTR